MSQPLTNVKPLPPLCAKSLLEFLDGLAASAKPMQEKAGAAPALQRVP
ncbi:hypothetical protein MHZ93_03985 [Roseomonas sp. ACRSG]|nr:hypothetical protein [Roseomonas sp. ACRSG]